MNIYTNYNQLTSTYNISKRRLKKFKGICVELSVVGAYSVAAVAVAYLFLTT